MPALPQPEPLACDPHRGPHDNLSRLRRKHHEVLERYVAGESNAAIGRAIDMTPTHVGEIVNSALFQHAAAIRREQQMKRTDEAGAVVVARAREKIARASETAVDSVVGIMRDSEASASTRLSAANSLLDRVLMKEDPSAPKVVINAANLTLIQEALRESAAPMKELVHDAGAIDVIDVDPSP